MPNFLGALPSRFRRPRLLIVGCGDVGQRVAAQLPRSVRLLALTSSPERLASLRAQGITPLQGNLDRPATLRRLSGLATQVLHLAPPPSENLSDWRRDPRTLALLRALRLRSLPQSVVYGSTSGVYGDCGGEWVNEARATKPGCAGHGASQSGFQWVAAPGAAPAWPAPTGGAVWRAGPGCPAKV